MFKYFKALLLFVTVNVALAVLTIATPFIVVYMIFSLFRKPHSTGEKGIGSSLLTTIVKEYATNKSKTVRPSEKMGGAETRSVRRPATEYENNEYQSS